MNQYTICTATAGTSRQADTSKNQDHTQKREGTVSSRKIKPCWEYPPVVQIDAKAKSRGLQGLRIYLCCWLSCLFFAMEILRLQQRPCRVSLGWRNGLCIFEWTWGGMHTWFMDLRVKYKVSEWPLQKIFHRKKAIVLKARMMWPFFLSFEEDKVLRDPRWNARYEGTRLFFWDDTNIEMAQPVRASLNRRTISTLWWECRWRQDIFST